MNPVGLVVIMPRSLCCLVFLMILFVSCKNADDTAPRTTYASLDGEATYVGIDVCKTCHAAQYDTYIQSEMGRSFKPATLSLSSARFDNQPPVYDPFNDLYYQPLSRGEALFIKEYRLSGSDTVFQRVEQIDYIVGSGQHTNSHIMEENGYLYQMPLTWYAQKGHWDLPPKFDKNNNYRFDRPISLECMTCHNAMPGFVEGSLNQFTHVPAGIDCERCHGPGSVHVADMQAGKVVNTTVEIDYTIVNPRKLPLDRQFDICQRCHMQGAAVFREGKTGFDFRPGMKLEEVENVFWPRYADSTKNFIMASHPDRLQLSACFQESHRQAEAPMTCITCHNPHVSIKVLGQEHYNQVCQSCHTPEKDNLCTEQPAVRATQADNCVACHMPVSGSRDIPHVRITDHYIRKVKDEETRQASTSIAQWEAQSFTGLASLIVKTPTDKDMADGYMTYYEEITNHPGFVDSAAVYLEQAEKATDQKALARSLIRLWTLQGAPNKIRNLAASLTASDKLDADSWYRIGEATKSEGDVSGAVRFFEKATGEAPHHLPYLNRLASAYSETGNHARALEVYNQVLQKNPKFGTAYNNRGFMHIMLGDYQKAEADFLTALKLDPDAILPMANLASLYFNTNRKELARPYMIRLLELDPYNEDYRQLWNLIN